MTITGLGHMDAPCTKSDNVHKGSKVCCKGVQSAPYLVITLLLFLHVKQTESPRDLKEPLQQPKNKVCVPGCMIPVLFCDMLTSPVVLRVHDAEKSWQNNAHVVYVLNGYFFRVNIGLVY